jgi:hypothetical protein
MNVRYGVIKIRMQLMRIADFQFTEDPIWFAVNKHFLLNNIPANKILTLNNVVVKNYGAIW